MVNSSVNTNSFDRHLLSQTQREPHHSIRILLVDDRNSVRQHLRISLETEPDLQIIGEAINGQDAIAKIAALAPDIALVDLEMPVMSGLEATQIIKERFANTKVIIFSSHVSNEYVEESLKVGAKGYLLKNASSEEIAHTIRYVHKGCLLLAPDVSAKLESAIVPVASSAITNTTHSINHSTEANLIPSQAEWSSSTKELVETLPRVWTRGLLYLGTIFIGIALPWMIFTKVDETGNARGRLEPQGKVYTVEAPVMGTVEDVLVKENQYVTARQPLLILESKPIETELEQIETRIEGQHSELGQLKVLQNQLLSTVNAQKQQNESQLLEKQAQIAQTRQSIQHLQSFLSLAEETYSKAQQELKRYIRAKDRGIIAEIQVVDRENIVREKKGSLQQAQLDLEQARLRLQEQEKNYESLIQAGNIAVLRNEEQLKEIEMQIGTLTSQIRENQTQIDALNYQLEQRIIKAPANGVVFQLPVQKTGSVLESGVLVAEIAPEQAPLIVKAQISSSESGFLKPGMSVKLKFDAYPFQDYGIVEGKLVRISPTTKMVDTEAGKIEAYELDIELDRNYILAKNKRIALKPGQKVTAEIIIRQRRLIDFVFDPFKKLQENGLEL